MMTNHHHLRHHHQPSSSAAASNLPRNSSNSDVDEFEDAIDSFHPPTAISTPARPMLPLPQNAGPAQAMNSATTPTSSRPSSLVSQGTSGLLGPPGGSVQQSGRRGRLANLRNRMQAEFGVSGLSAMRDVDWDDGTSLSERTSIASWGQNFLLERNKDASVIAVMAADTLSTKGPYQPLPPVPPVQVTPGGSSFQFPTRPAGAPIGVFDTPLRPPKRDIPGLVDVTPPAASTVAQAKWRQSPTSPPPTQPPPPLPERPRQSAVPTVTVPKPLGIPPPLPPRKTHLTPQPVILADKKGEGEKIPVKQQQKSQITPIKEAFEGEGLDLRPTTLTSHNSVDESRKKSNSTPISDLSNAAIYGKKRGHTKTKSLDRGISLAKSLKCGPFPPPASAGKSSSLNRGCSPSDMLAVGAVICEEDQAAHSVIEQITDAVLSSQSEDDEGRHVSGGAGDSRIMVKKAGKLEAAKPVESSSSSSSSDDEDDSDPRTPGFGARVGSENRRLRVVIKPPPIIPIATAALESTPAIPRYENIDNVSIADSAPADPMPSSSTPGMSVLPSATTALKVSTTNPHEDDLAVIAEGTMDPVARTVHRRLSMHGAASSHHVRGLSGTASSAGGDDRSTNSMPRAFAIGKDDFETTEDESAASSGLSRAKTAAQRLRTKASSFVRNVFTKARNMKTGGGHALHSDDDDGPLSDSEDCTASVVIDPVMSSANAAVIPVQPEIICRPKNVKKGPLDFEQLKVVQEIGQQHLGAIWVIKFSLCGRLFATGGEDRLVRIWVLQDHYDQFTRLREKLNHKSASGRSDFIQHTMQDIEQAVRSAAEDRHSMADDESTSSPTKPPTDDSGSVLQSFVVSPEPFAVLRHHDSDILDLSWSVNYFLLSSSCDRNVKLWHLTRSECLCVFQHPDFVPAIAFMPKDDRFFVSGSIDGKIRLWHIQEKKVVVWNEVEQAKFITAIAFVRNSKFVVVGTYNGRCFFYTTDQLKYHTVIDVRSSKKKNAAGNKITSLAVHGDKLLITSHDSKVRMYDLRDMNLMCKFIGAQVTCSQIRASFSPDGKHIACGSEDSFIYIWGTTDASISRKDVNTQWQRAKVHNDIVTTTVFAPKPQLFLSNVQRHLSNQISHAQCASPGVVGGQQIGAATAPGITQARRFPHWVMKRLDSEQSMDVVSSHGALSAVHIPMTSDTVSSITPTTATTPGSLLASSKTGSMRDRAVQGDVIISADVAGYIRILANPSKISTGSSNFF